MLSLVQIISYRILYAIHSPNQCLHAINKRLKVNAIVGVPTKKRWSQKLARSLKPIAHMCRGAISKHWCFSSIANLIFLWLHGCYFTRNDILTNSLFRCNGIILDMDKLLHLPHMIAFHCHDIHPLVHITLISHPWWSPITDIKSRYVMEISVAGNILGHFWTHWVRDKVANNLQTTFSCAFTCVTLAYLCSTLAEIFPNCWK